MMWRQGQVYVDAHVMEFKTSSDMRSTAELRQLIFHDKRVKEIHHDHAFDNP
jgi:hypothetical protein